MLEALIKEQLEYVLLISVGKASPQCAMHKLPTSIRILEIFMGKLSTVLVLSSQEKYSIIRVKPGPVPIMKEL